MGSLAQVVDAAIDSGRVPGAVALLSTAGGVEVVAAGSRAVGGPRMEADCLFRIASVTKPIVAAATMAMVERGVFDLDDPVDRWLGELSRPMVLRRIDGPVDDVVKASRPITIRHLLTLRGGLGVPERFDLPIVEVLFDVLGEGPPRPQERPGPDEWMRRVEQVPLLHQPGEGWTYNIGYEILGVLLSRAADAPLGEVLSETILDPAGLPDTAFWTATSDRMTTAYRRGGDGDLEPVDSPNGQWSTPPPFESGGGGLLSTVNDLAAFAQMLLHEGLGVSGRRVLSADSVASMMSPHFDGGDEHMFLDGQAWGFGGSVDIRSKDPWNQPGRYGWVGGTGTALYVLPTTGTAVIWLSQVEMSDPADFAATAHALTVAAEIGT